MLFHFKFYSVIFAADNSHMKIYKRAYVMIEDKMLGAHMIYVCLIDIQAKHKK